MSRGPHQDQEIVQRGLPLKSATAAMVMMHGRGASAHDIMTLADELEPEGFAFLAPQALGNSWYPYSFLAPLEDNEPGISSGIQRLSDLIEQIRVGGVAPEKTILLGFSQGACLSLEFAARNARRFGGLVGLSGGLIGPDGTPRDYDGSLQGTPVFLGCSDADFHIPRERVEHSAGMLERLDGRVTMRLYRGMGHTVNQDEIDVVNEMMRALL